MHKGTIVLGIVILLVGTLMATDDWFCWHFMKSPFLSPIMQAVDKAVFKALTTIVDSASLNFLDGPTNISEAKTFPGMPCGLNEDELQFYSYLAASAYCYILNGDGPLDCCYCKNIADTVSYYTVLRNCSLSAGTKALVTVHPAREEIVVSYRGSINWINVMLDFEMVKVSSSPAYMDIRVHDGFNKSTSSLYYQVLDTLKALVPLYPGYRLTFNGHSLGGSMAALTAFYMDHGEEFPNNPMSLITFGQPRVGNQQYALYMNNYSKSRPRMNMCRVVNKADVVPHFVPVDYDQNPDPKPWDCYIHHMQEIWMNPQNELKYCSLDYLEDKNCSNSLSPDYVFNDHMIYLGVDYSTCMVEDFLENILSPLNFFSVCEIF